MEEKEKGKKGLTLGELRSIIYKERQDEVPLKSLPEKDTPSVNIGVKSEGEIAQADTSSINMGQQNDKAQQGSKQPLGDKPQVNTQQNQEKDRNNDLK